MHIIPFLRAFAAQCIIALRVQDEWVAVKDKIPESKHDAFWQSYKKHRRYQLVF